MIKYYDKISKLKFQGIKYWDEILDISGYNIPSTDIRMMYLQRLVLREVCGVCVYSEHIRSSTLYVTIRSRCMLMGDDSIISTLYNQDFVCMISEILLDISVWRLMWD